MKNSKTLIITALTFTLMTNIFSCSPALAKGFKRTSKIAVVDLQKVMEKSSKLNPIITERNNKTNELRTAMEKSQSDIANESNDTKRKALIDKYNKELNEKQSLIDQIYSKKFDDVNNEITELINAKADALGYDVVFVKGVVLKGGDDITSEIIKDVK